MKDLTGMKFGRWTVIKYAGMQINVTKTRTKLRPYFLCKCDCGTKRIVRGSGLTNGSSHSCGCYNREMSTFKNTKMVRLHDIKLYNVWKSIKQRCLNQNCKAYPDYGGRGITICDEWKNDFWSFYDWSIDNGYANRLTIDRKDNNKGYCPDNCRIATYKEQALNTRRNHYITIDGETKTAQEWADISGIDQKLICDRVARGWVNQEILMPRKGSWFRIENYRRNCG